MLPHIQGVTMRCGYSAILFIYVQGAVLTLACSDVRAANTKHDSICVVPVAGSSPAETGILSIWDLASNAFRIPGLPSIVFAPVRGLNKQYIWAIDQSRRLVHSETVFPRSYLQRGSWLEEPWSGRTVAPVLAGGVSAVKPGRDQFEKFRDHPFSGNSLRLLTSQKQTIAFRYGSNEVLVVGDDALYPWPLEAELEQQGINRIADIYEWPSMKALLVEDFDRHLRIRTEDGQWFYLGRLGHRGHQLFDATGSGLALLINGQEVTAIRKTKEAFSAETLLTTYSNGADRRFFKSKIFHEAMGYTNAGTFWRYALRWQRFTASGVEDIPGGDIGPRALQFARAQDIPSLNRVVIWGTDGLFFYDGHAITPIAGSGNEELGPYIYVHDLPAIGHVLVTTEKGIFELTGNGKLNRVEFSFPTEGRFPYQIMEWAEAGLALINPPEGLFAIDKNLSVFAVPGGKQVRPLPLTDPTFTNPATGEMVLAGRDRLYLAVQNCTK